MARAIWRGVVTFANIRVPVKLYSAVSEQRVKFHLLHDQDEVRLRQQMVCDLEDKPVPREEQAKALHVGDERFVLVEQHGDLMEPVLTLRQYLPGG